MKNTYRLTEGTIRFFIEKHKNDVEYFDNMIERTINEPLNHREWILLKKICCEREKVEFT